MIPAVTLVSSKLSSFGLRLSMLPVVLAGLLLPAATRAQVSYTGTTANQNFGSQAIGSASAAKTMNFSIAAGTTVGSIAVVTQGATGLDFTEATGSTCAAQAYTSASVCTVNVTFTPRFAGMRSGAVVFYSGPGNTGNVLGKAMVYGAGAGPQIAYTPSAAIAIPTTVDGIVQTAPGGLAVDAAGDLFIVDSLNGHVLELPAGGGATITIAPTANGQQLDDPFDVAVDGAGDLFISSGDSVFEVPMGGGATTALDPTVAGEGLSVPVGLAVNGAGDLFIADDVNNRVVRVPAGGGAAIAIDPIVNGKGLSSPTEVVVDGAGNLFITDYYNNRVVEVPGGGGAAIVLNPIVNGIGISIPASLAVDGLGNLFIADSDNVRVVEVPVGGGVATAFDPVVSGQSFIRDISGLAVDGAGNLFVSEYTKQRVVEIQRSKPPELIFSATPVDSTSNDSPQAVQIENTGNSVLLFTAISYPTDFPEEAGGGADPCTGSTSLSAGQQCNLNVDFSPQSTPYVSENVTLTDNALNSAGAQQSVSVSGNLTTVTLSATELQFPSQSIGTASATQQVTLTNSGISPLSIIGIDVGGTYSASFVIQNNCGTSLAAGASCTIQGYFEPAQTGSVTAAITITDNAYGSPQSITLTGAGIAPQPVSLSAESLSFGSLLIGTTSATQQVTLTNSGNTTLSVSSIQLTGTDASSFVSSNNCGTSLASGASCKIGARFIPSKAGVLSAAVSINDNASNSPQSFNLFGIGSATVVFNGTAGNLNFGSQAIGSVSSANPLAFSIAAGTKVGSIAVVTQGAAGLDFANAAGSTCTAQEYTSTTDCTVNVTFTPRATGLRRGAVVFYSGANNTGTALDMALVYGVGTGPQIAFGPGKSTTIDPEVSGKKLSFPEAVAVDSLGNMFIADTGNSRVLELPAGGGPPAVIALPSNGNHPLTPEGLAVDGAGDLFIADTDNQQVLEVPAGGGSVTAIGLAVNGQEEIDPGSIAVDGAGNLFASDNYDYPPGVLELPAGGGAVIAIDPTVNGRTVNFVPGLAVDGAGNLFIGDFFYSRVVEVPANGDAATEVIPTLNGAEIVPNGLAVDSAGDLYITEQYNGNVTSVLEVPVGETAAIAIEAPGNGPGFNNPLGVAVDGAGNVFVADTSNNRIVEIQRSQAPLLTFADTLVYSTSSDSPQTVQIQNIGNQLLTFTGLSYPTDFPEEAGGGTDPCTASTSLGAGQQCNLNIDFIPQSASYLSEALTLTDDTLNVNGAQQLISVSGNLTTVSISAKSISFGSQPVGTTSASHHVTLANTGDTSLFIGSISVTGADASSFTLGNNCGTSLAIGASCTIDASFTPTMAGALTAVIAIIDGASGSPQSITLSGTGFVPKTTTVSLSAARMSFGIQEVGTTSASQDVTLTNTGNGPFAVASFAVTGADASSFFFTNDCGASLAAGANCTIHGHFTPTAAGPLTAAVTIAGNATGSPLSIALSGTGYNPTTVSLLSRDVSYGLQQVGTNSALQDVMLTNTGSIALDIASITVSGADPSSFVVASNTSVWPNGCGSSLAAGASCLIHGHFAPKAEGPLTALVTITDSSAITSPHTIILRGTGYNPTTVSLSPTSLWFGIQKVGIASASQDVTLTNSGTATLYIASIGVSGTDASSFGFANSTPVYPVGCGTSLAIGASCVIHGHFTPTAAGALAARIIVSDSASGSPQRIALSGIGYDAPTTVSLSATSITFGSQTVGTTSASQNVILTNTGGTALAIASITMTGTNASSFIFANSCGTSVAAGASCTIHGHFTPTATGPLTAAVTITDNASGSPQTITLSGTGQ